MSEWSGHKNTAARAIVATWLPADCGQCGEPVLPTQRWNVGHKIARSLRPDLMWEVSNWQPEHRACSDKTGQAAVIAKAKAEALASAGVFFPDDLAGQTPPLPVSLPRAKEPQWEVREALSWPVHVLSAPVWLRPYLDPGAHGNPPLAVTPVHPNAVGSYGPELIEWARKERGITFRWWQAYATVRSLEHDADGALCWSTVVESGPRRAGKSERLRSVALWRMERGVALFEPEQVVVHVGRDLPIVREVQERAWRWCEARDWKVTRANGKEKVEHPNGARWLAKAQNAGYGFDVHLGIADECWDVEPGAISEGIEPATLDRKSAQLVLTSTSHRKATSLMKRRIADALARDDNRTLLLLWGAMPGADLYDEATWKAASPYWTEERRVSIADKLEKAREAGPEIDDPDPVGSWAHQYLNRWDLSDRVRAPKGEAVVTEDDWEALKDLPPIAVPDGAAIESGFNTGISLAFAWRVADQVVVSVSDHDDLASAAAAVTEAEMTTPVVVGESLYDDPALRSLRRRKAKDRLATVVESLSRLLTEDALRHDGADHLTGQVLDLRTVAATDGPRMASSARHDAVKAAVWAAQRARLRNAGNTRIVLPSRQ